MDVGLSMTIECKNENEFNLLMQRCEELDIKWSGFITATKFNPYQITGMLFNQTIFIFVSFKETEHASGSILWTRNPDIASGEKHSVKEFLSEYKDHDIEDEDISISDMIFASQ